MYNNNTPKLNRICVQTEKPIKKRPQIVHKYSIGHQKNSCNSKPNIKLIKVNQKKVIFWG